MLARISCEICIILKTSSDCMFYSKEANTPVSLIHLKFLRNLKNIFLSEAIFRFKNVGKKIGCLKTMSVYNQSLV